VTQDPIGLCVFDVRVTGDDVARELRGFRERQAAIRPKHLCAERGRAQPVHGDTEPRGGQIGASQLRGLPGCGCERGRIAILDDDSIGEARIGGHCRHRCAHQEPDHYSAS
jgi:hypothetical protein